LGLPATKEVNDELVIKELWMETLRERKRKRIKNILLNSPLTFILIIINMVLVGWILHILHVIFTDALDHMSLYEWTEHLYILAKNTFEEFFASISSVF
jgi:predicted nucleic acid-binding Zn ribbon protein